MSNVWIIVFYKKFSKTGKGLVQVAPLNSKLIVFTLPKPTILKSKIILSRLMKSTSLVHTPKAYLLCGCKAHRRHVWMKAFCKSMISFIHYLSVLRTQRNEALCPFLHRWHLRDWAGPECASSRLPRRDHKTHWKKSYKSVWLYQVNLRIIK